MKKILVLMALFMAGLGFSQNEKPVLEAEGQLVKATYFYNNGKVQQVGYFKDGKLDGKWTSFDTNGNVSVIAQYTNGEKSGKWVYYSDSITMREVNFSDNQIVAVKNGTQNAIVNKN